MTDRKDKAAGGLKQAMNKVTDTVGGMVGQMGAATTVSADFFVEQAAIGDRYEIEASMIALRRARTEGVILAASQMLQDHTASTHQLEAALETNETRGMERPPAGLDKRRASMIQHLEETPDDAFEQTWLDQQVLAHEETVKLLRGYASSGSNPQLRSLAMSGAPVVERHLDHMKMLRGAL